MNKYWCDFSASILLEGENEEDVKNKFWEFIHYCEQTDYVNYVELNCVEKTDVTKKKKQQRYNYTRKER
jgi:hypothetical protein